MPDTVIDQNNNDAILDFASFLIYILNTNIFETQNEKDNIAFVDLIFRLLIELPQITCSSQNFIKAMQKDTIKSVLFDDKYNNIYAETYILSNTKLFKKEGKNMLNEIFGHIFTRTQMNTPALSHTKYLCNELFKKLKDKNIIYHRAIAKMIEVVLPLCTFTEEENDDLSQYMQTLLTNEDMQFSTRINIGNAIVKMISVQEKNFHNLIPCLEEVMIKKDYIGRGLFSVDPHLRMVLRDSLYVFCKVLEKKDKTKFSANFSTLFSYSTYFIKNCKNYGDMGDYFNLLCDIIKECDVDPPTDMLKRLVFLISYEKLFNKSIRNVILKLLYIVVRKYPKLSESLQNKEKIVSTLHNFDSFSPITMKIINFLYNSSPEFKDLFEISTRNFIQKYGLEKLSDTLFSYKNSLELCLLHVLSNVPALERVVLDININKIKSDFMKGILVLFMWFKHGSNKITGSFIQDISIILNKLRSKNESSTFFDTFNYITNILLSLPNGSEAFNYLRMTTGLNFTPDENLPENTFTGFGISVPSDKSLSEAIENVTYFDAPGLLKDKQMDFIKLPHTLLIHINYPKQITPSTAIKFGDTLSLKDFVSPTKTKGLPEKYYNYTLSGLISYFKEDGKNNYVSYIKIKDKWFNVTKGLVLSEDIHDPSREPLLLVYTRPFIRRIDNNMLYDSVKTKMLFDDGGFASVELLDGSTNLPLLNEVKEGKEVNLFEKPFSAERVHFALQSMDISNCPLEIINYIIRATYVNDKLVDTEIEKYLEYFRLKVLHDSLWRKACIGNFEKGYLYSMWTRSRNKKLLSCISKLYSLSFTLERLQKSYLSNKIVYNLINFCTDVHINNYCINILLDIDEDRNNATTFCNPVIFSVLGTFLKNDNDNKIKPDKETRKGVATLLSHIIQYVLDPAFNYSNKSFSKKELNDLLIQNNLLKTILEDCEEKEGTKIVECISSHDIEMLVPLGKIVLEFLGLSKNIEDDTRTFSFIKAYLKAEDKQTQTRLRLILSPHTFQYCGVLAVHHRSKEMSLNRLALYIDFMIGLGPNKLNFLARWHQDIAAFENLLVQKLLVIIDKDIVFDALAESESKFGIPKNKSKYWVEKKPSTSSLNKPDKKLLNHVILFKNRISNHILLTHEKHSECTENVFLKSILAANAICTGTPSGEFVNTFEGAVTIDNLLTQVSKTELEPNQEQNQENKNNSSFNFFDKRPKLDLTIDYDDPDVYILD